MEINVIDTIMGSGKTSASINFINSSDDSVKFMYITPYLTEVKRILYECKYKKFKQPESYGTKINGIKHLLNNGDNIVSTHSLFHNFDQEIIDLAYSQNYILIMDEVTDVVVQYGEIGRQDLKTILDNYASIDEETGLLKWTDFSYTDKKFQDEKRLAEMNCLAVYGGVAMLWLFPMDTFKAFRKIYLLTYMFEAQTQKYYYDYYGVKYKYLYVAGDDVSNYHFTEEKINYKKENYKNLIHICNHRKINMIGDTNTSLSKGWYERNKNNVLMDRLKNNTYNYFTNIIQSKSSSNLWTTFKDYQSILRGMGYAKGFLSSNTRATNEFKNKNVIAYLLNKYFNPVIRNFFTGHGVTVDEDAYATSEMLQFIWRSAIREGKEIWIYIPSSRMRNLLEKWIDENSIKE